MNTAKQDVSKLPRWAQFRIRKLEADVEHYAQVAGRIESGTSKVTFGNAHLGRGLVYLPDNDVYTFIVDGHSIGIRIVKEEVGEVLDVNALGRQIQVLPYASNRIQVRVP